MKSFHSRLNLPAPVSPSDTPEINPVDTQARAALQKLLGRVESLEKELSELKAVKSPVSKADESFLDGF